MHDTYVNWISRVRRTTIAQVFSSTLENRVVVLYRVRPRFDIDVLYIFWWPTKSPQRWVLSRCFFLFSFVKCMFYFKGDKTFQLIYWDDRNIYIEHEFVTLLDNFVRAVALSKQSVTDARVHLTEIIHKIEPGAMKPMLTEEVRLWMDSMEESSMRFRRMRDIIEETELDTISTDPFLPSCSS